MNISDLRQLVEGANEEAAQLEEEKDLEIEIETTKPDQEFEKKEEPRKSQQQKKMTKNSSASSTENKQPENRQKKKGRKWHLQDRFCKMLKSCRHPSKRQIRDVAEFACKHSKWYKTIVHLITKYVRYENPAKHSKLPLLYIIDAICRLSLQKNGKTDQFSQRFEQNLGEIFKGVCIGPEKDKGEIKRVCKLWKKKKFFKEEMMNSLLKKCADFPDKVSKKKKNRSSRHESSSSNSDVDAGEKKRRKSKSATPLKEISAALKHNEVDFDYGDSDEPGAIDFDELTKKRKRDEMRLQKSSKRKASGDENSHARKKRKLSRSPSVEVDKHHKQRRPYPKELPLVTGRSPIRQHDDDLEEFTAPDEHLRKKINGPDVVGFCLTENQEGIVEGFYRVMSTTLWLGKRGGGTDSEEIILRIVKKFGQVSDVIFRQEDVFIKYQEREDAAHAHKVLSKQLDDGTKRFNVGWGKPPRIPPEAFNFQNGVGVMSAGDLEYLSRKMATNKPPAPPPAVEKPSLMPAPPRRVPPPPIRGVPPPSNNPSDYLQPQQSQYNRYNSPKSSRRQRERRGEEPREREHRKYDYRERNTQEKPKYEYQYEDHYPATERNDYRSSSPQKQRSSRHNSRDHRRGRNRDYNHGRRPPPLRQQQRRYNPRNEPYY